MTSSLVGSEMCIRDRCWQAFNQAELQEYDYILLAAKYAWREHMMHLLKGCLLYTSDAADDM
eukprot:3521474-Prorocentrum_lima.AAC.1